MREVNFLFKYMYELKTFCILGLFVFLFHYNKAKLLSRFVFRYFNREEEKSNLGTREAQSILLIINVDLYVVMLHLKVNAGHCGIHV